MLRALNHRPFALLWLGQVISRLGDGLYRVALAWLVLEKTGSAAVMGTVLILTSIPALIFALIGGVMVDRLSRVRVMLASDVVRGLIISIIAFLTFQGQLEIWHVYVSSVLFGFVDAFFVPAYSATIPELTPSVMLTSANSLTSISRDSVNIIGPSIGAGIVFLGGTAAAFGLDGLSFFLSAVFLIPLLRLSRRPADGRARQSMLHDLQQGIGTLIGTPWLWISISISALSNLTLFSPFFVAMPFLVKNALGGDVGSLGMVYSAFAVGSVLGAAIVGRSVKIRHRGPLAYGVWLLSGVMTLLIGLSPSIYAVLFASLVVGASVGAFGLIWNYLLQELIPNHLLGRVASIDYLGSFMLMPVGYALVGWATDRVGAAPVFIVGGAITSLMIILGLLHPAIRQLD